MFKDKRVLNFTKIFAGSSVAQAITLLLYPYIARLYTPQDFSRFGFIFSLIAIISVFATGQFQAALLIPESDDEVDELVGLSFFFICVSSILVLLFFIFYDRSLLIAPIFLFVYSLFDVQRMLYIRKQAYNETFISQILYRGLGNAGKLLPPFVNLGHIGLAVSELLSLLCVTIYGFTKFKFKIGFNKKLIHKYKIFPLYHTLTMGTYILLNDFPILVWSSIYDKTLLGYYVMGQRLLIVPIQVVGNAIQGSTIHNILGTSHPRKELGRIITGLLFLGMTGSIFFYLVGESLITYILGPKWIGGIFVFKCMSLIFASKLILSVTQTILTVHNSSKAILLTRATQILILLLATILKLEFEVAFLFFIFVDIGADAFLSVLAVRSFKNRF